MSPASRPIPRNNMSSEHSNPPPEPAARKSITTLRLVLIAAVGIAVVTSACGFILSETERAIVLRFGKPSRIIERSGLYFRLPAPLETVVRVDRRIQHSDIRLSETLTRDQRNVIVPMFFTWRVADALNFHTSVKEIATANAKLDAIVTSARNSVLGSHNFAALTGQEAVAKSLESLEQEMHALAAPDALEHLGIELLSTGITSIKLPEANTEAVFQRMRAERKREATQFRAEGRAQAAEMKAAADKESTRVIAEAKSQAEQLRGEAEATAAAVYAAAHGSDPGFYRFLRELQSLRTVVDKNTTLVLDTSVAPFHWLKSVEDSNKPLIPSPPIIPRTHQQPTLTQQQPPLSTLDPATTE